MKNTYSKRNMKSKEFYEHKPFHEFKASLSKDGRFWIFKDITVHVVPCSYIDKVRTGKTEANVSASTDSNQKVVG